MDRKRKENNSKPTLDMKNRMFTQFQVPLLLLNGSGEIMSRKIIFKA
jgi:hypothetical protein